MKFKFKLYCGRLSVGQFVLVSCPFWSGCPDDTFLWVTTTCLFFHVGRPLWREFWSVISSAMTQVQFLMWEWIYDVYSSATLNHDARWRWVVSVIPLTICTWQTAPVTRCVRSCLGNGVSLGDMKKKNIFTLLRIKPQLLGCLTGTLVAIPNALSRFLTRKVRWNINIFLSVSISSLSVKIFTIEPVVQRVYRFENMKQMGAAS
jgi:hypothetical protein